METLGEKLKKLREEKGMTLKEVANAIKVRESALSALENEEWSKLPQRIFVRGFVRAYAKAVGGNEEEILDLFDSSCPIENATISCPSFETQPFTALKRDKKKYGWILAVIILLLLAAGLYFLLAHFYSSTHLFSGKTSTRVETTVVKPQKETTGNPAAASPEQEAKTSQTGGGPAYVEEKASVMTSQGAPSVTTEKKAVAPAPSQGTNSSENASTVSPSQKAKTEKSKNPSSSGQSQPSAAPMTTATPKDNLIITAKMETWIGLKIGGKMRKQILLKPGKTFATHVEQPVELLIGNAGGIEITYKGKKIENIGKPGEVVRLKLPPEKNP